MQDITRKLTTLRTATAQAVVHVSRPETIEMILEKRVPKGDVFEMSKAAGLLAVKKTSDMIPDCHPLPVEAAGFSYDVSEHAIRIVLEVKTIYKTGVEVEAMHGVSVAALTMYDMLKPLDKGVEIASIKLLEKTGGKTDYLDRYRTDLKAAVLVCSDSVYAGEKKDKSGREIMRILEDHGIIPAEYAVMRDDLEHIREIAEMYVENGMDLIIFTGGTGVSSRDVTPEAIRPILDKELPGLMESARAYGMERMPYAMFSRGIAGMKGNTLILTLPGSARAATEYMDALFPFIFHLFRIADDKGHG
ncbi:MAG: bifunctional molybdenum cofactor biosynthesis protein MoaC/MoaB [Bacteroidetes bacterium]|nr:bifunctional molybdenum cofactor biosynthesis protein MoaC/MoaB [Bacteroidota bacterium]